MVAILRVSVGGGRDGKRHQAVGTVCADSRARSDSLFNPRETQAGLTHCLSWLYMAMFALYSYTQGSWLVLLLLFLLLSVLCGQFGAYYFSLSKPAVAAEWRNTTKWGWVPAQTVTSCPSRRTHTGHEFLFQTTDGSVASVWGRRQTSAPPNNDPSNL